MQYIKSLKVLKRTEASLVKKAFIELSSYSSCGAYWVIFSKNVNKFLLILFYSWTGITINTFINSILCVIERS